MEKLIKFKNFWSKRPLAFRLWSLALCLLVFTLEIQHALKGSASEGSLKIAAKRDLSAGAIISVHDLTVSLQPESSSKNQSTFTDQEIHEIVGRRLLTDLPVGTVFQRTHLEQRMLNFSQKVPKGLRAFLVRTHSKLPLEPADRIDLVGTKENHIQNTHLILEDKRVLALNKKEDHQEILVALSPEDIQQIQSFNGDGWLDVTLRNPTDEGPKEKKKKEKKTKNRAAIEVLEGV